MILPADRIKKKHPTLFRAQKSIGIIAQELIDGFGIVPAFQ